MSPSATELRADAERIWRAGVAAVRPDRLIPSQVSVDGDWLRVGDEAIDLRRVRRIAMVGAGKAAGAMAVALENVLGPQLLAEKNVTGWVNVPADCTPEPSPPGGGQGEGRRVQLHAARPTGINEPRPEGVEGTQRILELVSSLRPDDLCLCVLAGGGSALLPAPVPEISLDDKIRVTRLLSAAGANIEQLNTVRRELSLVKGGGLARACRAGRLISLLISDVPGNPLDIIASGPTVIRSTQAGDALAVLEDLGLVNDPEITAVVQYLKQRGQDSSPSGNHSNSRRGPVEKESRSLLVDRPRPVELPVVTHFILGDNATAVDAAGSEAERLGYSHALIAANSAEGPAEEVGRHLADMARRMRREPGPDCLISGGEPTVMLVDESRRGKGGRNQQLALAALTQLGDCAGIALLSGGTDGEDGPTDAAGAFATQDVVRAAREQQLDPHDYLARNDAYHFFQNAGGLFITGPTQTNVCDLRVIAIARGTGTK